MSTEIRGKISVDVCGVPMPIHYVVRLSLHPIVMEAHISGTYYTLNVLPPDVKEAIFNACIEAAQEEAADRALEAAQINQENAEGRDA